MSSTNQQNSPPSELQATQKPKQRKPRIPAATQQAIIAKASLGETNTKIANDLGVARNTVSALLSTSDIARHVDEIRSDFVLQGDLWQARRVMRQRLDKGSESAATTILRGFNVLRSGDTNITNIQNNGAMSWTQIIEAKKAENERNTTTNSDPTPEKP